jgi:type IV pilus modification protein PilV
MGDKKSLTILSKIKHNEQGFTLLEIIIAISILSIGLLALASLQLASIRGNAFASGVTEGTTLAADRIEKLLALPYNHADLFAGSHTDSSPPSGYAVTWQVTDDAPVTNTKTIDLTVTWTDHGAQKNVIMHRIMPRMM